MFCSGISGIWSAKEPLQEGQPDEQGVLISHATTALHSEQSAANT